MADRPPPVHEIQISRAVDETGHFTGYSISLVRLSPAGDPMVAESHSIFRVWDYGRVFACVELDNTGMYAIRYGVWFQIGLVKTHIDTRVVPTWKDGRPPADHVGEFPDGYRIDWRCLPTCRINNRLERKDDDQQA